MTEPIAASKNYRVYFTPKSGTYAYGDELEVTDYVTLAGIGKVRSQIDADDYNIGVFTYDDLDLTCLNLNGIFNEESDNRSIFTFTRDQAKVRVVFNKITTDEETGTTEEDEIVFRGIINDEATKANAKNDEIKFKVLSRDSVIRKTKVPAGIITDGMTVSAAFLAIMNQSAITAVLSTAEADVNPDLDFVIDVGSEFDDKSCREALNDLLRSSNSVMLIDDDGVVTIKDRTEDETRSPVNLYGPFDIHRRQNTSDLLDYNTGRQRMFNSVRVNDTVVGNTGYQIQFGFRQFEVDFAFVTEEDTQALIAENLLNEFKYPKLECKVEVPLSSVEGIQLLDRVSLDWPVLIKPWNMFFPVVGITKIGESGQELPIRLGSIDISPNVKWKVIQIEEDPKKFTKTLKLRQAGVDIADGYFNIPANSIVGFAVIGDGIIGGTGETSYNPSVIGAAQIGNTLIS